MTTIENKPRYVGGNQSLVSNLNVDETSIPRFILVTPDPPSVSYPVTVDAENPQLMVDAENPQLMVDAENPQITVEVGL